MERANAATLAKRTIRNAKTPRRQPIVSNSTTPQQQSMSFGGGGAIFGNSLPQNNTFSFAAPAAPSLSFPPTTNFFGNQSSPEHSESEDAAHNPDRYRPDPTGEEAKRRNKGFRPEATPQNTAQTPFGGSTTNNIFGNTSSTSNPFSFNQPQLAPPTTFNSTPANAQPTSNLFSFNAPQQPAPAAPTITTGTDIPQNKPADMTWEEHTRKMEAEALAKAQMGQSNTPKPNPFFGGGSAPSQPFQFNNPMPSTQSPAPNGVSIPSTPSIFSQPPAQPSNNLFNGVGQQNGGLFGSSTAQTQSPAKSFFPTASQPKPDLFANSSGDLGSRMTFPSTQASENPSGTAPSTSRGIWDPVPAPDAKALGTSWAQPNASTPGNAPAGSSSLFGRVTSHEGSAEPESTSVTAPSASGNMFGSTPVTAPSGSGNMFGRVSEPDASATPAVPAQSLFGAQPTSSSSSLFGPKPTSSLFGAKPAPTPTPASPVKESSLFQSKPANSGPSQTQPTSNNIFAPSNPEGPAPSLFSNLNKPVDPNLKFGHTPESIRSLPDFGKPMQPTPSALTNGSVAKVPDTSLAKSEINAGQVSDSAIQHLVPSEFTIKQRKQFYKAYRIRSLNKAMQSFFASIPADVDPANAMAYFTEMRQVILGRAAVSGSKRKEIDGENHNNEAENPSKRSKADASFGPPQPQASVSPTKAPSRLSETQPSINGNGIFQAASSVSASQGFFSSAPSSQTQPFGTANNKSSSTLFNPPQASAETPASASAKSKRKADEQLTKDIFESQQREISKTSKFGSDSGRSNTSALFQSIAESPSKSGTEKKIKSLPSATSSDNEEKRSNPFASIPTSPTKPKALTPPVQATPSTPSLFAPLNAPVPSTAPGATSNNSFGHKSAANPFKPSTPSTIQAPKSAAPANPFQLSTPTTAQAPNSGAPVNFLAQFGQKAAKDKEAHEKKLMEEAEAADFDSDEEDLKSWRAKYKLKRKAELEEIENIAKTKKPRYEPGKGFTYDSATTSTNKSTTLGMSTALDRASASGTSSPARSIFETGTPPVADVDNPFSKFVQPTPPDDSESEEVEDEESGDSKSEDGGEGDDEAEVDADSENKDPNYQPEQESSGPGTPVEETGVGIAASAKKGGLFSFGSGKGTQDLAEKADGSPAAGKSSLSLFDRVSYPAGHPMGASSDEKENTKPTEVKSIFGNPTQSFGGSFGSGSGTPTNQTWDQTKGINFGSSTAPSVNITSATPTKPASAGLFGNSKPSTPGGGLFGAATGTSNLFNFGPSPSAGHNFGAPASGTSSLLPSTAVSNNTSRATTPGATSDDGEADPDGVKHAQADFTRGAGEEDEDVLFESKARASKLKGKEWLKYVGVVRVLKNKETGATRILHRREPTGAVVMNYSIPNTKYTSTKSSLAMVLLEEEGKFATWSITVKTPEEAEKLVAVLNEHKNV